MVSARAQEQDEKCTTRLNVDNDVAEIGRHCGGKCGHVVLVDLNRGAAAKEGLLIGPQRNVLRVRVACQRWVSLRSE